MITNDKEWFSLVYWIARRITDRTLFLRASGYLWDGMNWDRLSETTHGKFIRELDNDHPDLVLRAMYREQILSEGKEISGNS